MPALGAYAVRGFLLKLSRPGRAGRAERSPRGGPLLGDLLKAARRSVRDKARETGLSKEGSFEVLLAAPPEESSPGGSLRRRSCPEARVYASGVTTYGKGAASFFQLAPARSTNFWLCHRLLIGMSLPIIVSILMHRCISCKICKILILQIT